MIYLIMQGVLRGFDQATNLILDESHERVYSTKVLMYATVVVLAFHLSLVYKLLNERVIIVIIIIIQQ